MPRPSRYALEVRKRAVGMVQEHAQEYASQWEAISSIASTIGRSGETPRKWGRQTERDAGQRPGAVNDAGGGSLVGYSELERNRDAMARFGPGSRPGRSGPSPGATLTS